MSKQKEFVELILRCREIAVQLDDIGEVQHAKDIRALLGAYITALGGNPNV